MEYTDLPPHLCPHHGRPSKRAICRECNAAYMRNYLRRRRYEQPAKSLWDRARKRALDRDLPFSIDVGSIRIPSVCPAIGIPVQFRGERSASSPSLDRIVPELGYVFGNIRVISDRANRLKGDRDLNELRRLAEHGPCNLREEYQMVAAYLDRELLLGTIRAKAVSQIGRSAQEWRKIAGVLDDLFSAPIPV